MPKRTPRRGARAQEPDQAWQGARLPHVLGDQRHLPTTWSSEQIEAIISTFGDMASRSTTRRLTRDAAHRSDATPVAQTDEDVRSRRGALSTWIPSSAHYDRCACTCAKWARRAAHARGEIEIAKRIEEGLRHMIQRSAPADTVREILDLRQGEKDESRIDEVVDG